MCSSMLVPLVGLFFLLLGAYQKDLDFARAEIKGAKFGPVSVKPLAQAFEFNLNRTSGGDNTDVKARRQASVGELKSLADDFAADLKFNDADLTSRKREGMTPAAVGAKLDAFMAAPSDQAYGEVLNGAKAVLAHTGDMSNLILDPDLDSYYLMDGWLAAVPAVLERSHDLVQALVAGDHAQADILAGILTAVDLPRALGDIDVAITEDGNFYGVNENMQKTLRGDTDAWAADLKAFVESAKKVNVKNKEQIVAVRKLAIENIQRTEAFWNKMTGHLIALLEARDAYISQQRRNAVIMCVALLLVCGFVVRFGASAIARSLDELAEVLKGQTEAISSESEKIATGSTELSSTVTEQASALQETSTTMHEVATIAVRNSDTVSESMQEAIGTIDKIEHGRQALNELMNSVRALEGQQNDSTKILQKYAEEVARIESFIREISTKTSQINDIVFQTKLLSFNASVEAARAGEHGKGFAVVAEEVGVLANQSGSAAKDINGHLDNTLKMVSGITQQIIDMAKSMETQTKSVLDMSRSSAQKCSTAFDQITQVSKALTNRLQDIVGSSKEQTTAVKQISTGITEIDRATQESSNVAHASAASASELAEGVGKLKHIAQELNSLIRGKAA